MLGKSTGAVRTASHRGLRRLERLLTEQAVADGDTTGDLAGDRSAVLLAAPVTVPSRAGVAEAAPEPG